MSRLAAGIAALAAALALAACGDEEEDGEGPAALVPASALVYAEAALRPEGEERTAIEAPLAALLDTEDPGGFIVSELEKAVSEGGSEVTWEEDVEPWLGERGAFFLSSLYEDDEDAPATGDDGCLPPESGEDAAVDDAAEGCALPDDDPFGESAEDGAFVVESTDADAAQAFVEKIAAEEGSVEDASYEGVDYLTSEEGGAAGVVGDAVVLGTVSGFEQVVDTESGGDALADDGEFDALLGEDEDAAARLFADVPEILAAADDAGELDAEDREAFDTVFAGIAEQPVTAVLDAETTGFGFEYSYGSIDLPFFAVADAESELLASLPEDSWLAAAYPEVGESIGSLFADGGELGIPSEELEEGARELERAIGMEPAEVFAPLGDAAVFAAGEGIFGAGGGLVVETDDPDAAAELVEALERAARRDGAPVQPLSGVDGAGFSLPIPDAPAAVNVVAGEERIVLAYGDAATEAALDPEAAAGTLGDSEAFAEAADELGDDYEPGAYVDFKPMLDLLQLGSMATADPAIDEAIGYLESLEFLVAGSRTDGERDSQRFFLGIADVVDATA